MQNPFKKNLSRIFHTSDGWFIGLRLEDIQQPLTIPHINDGTSVFAGPFKTRRKLESWFDFYIATHQAFRPESADIPDQTCLPDFNKQLAKSEIKLGASSPAFADDRVLSAKQNNAKRSLQGVRILLIDDSRSFQSLTRAMLEKLGATDILLASTLSEGLGLICGETGKPTRHIDVILMDINLPDGNGIQGCEFVSGFHASRRIPVVAISGLTTPEMIRKALHAGARDFLKKPFSGVELGNRIQSQLPTR